MNQPMTTIKRGKVSAFAKANGLSQQVVQNRITKGWRFGKLNGDLVMYSPKSVHLVLNDSEIQEECK